MALQKAECIQHRLATLETPMIGSKIRARICSVVRNVTGHPRNLSKTTLDACVDSYLLVKACFRYKVGQDRASWSNVLLNPAFRSSASAPAEIISQNIYNQASVNELSAILFSLPFSRYFLDEIVLAMCPRHHESVPSLKTIRVKVT